MSDESVRWFEVRSSILHRRLRGIAAAFCALVGVCLGAASAMDWPVDLSAVPQHVGVDAAVPPVGWTACVLATFISLGVAAAMAWRRPGGHGRGAVVRLGLARDGRILVERAGTAPRGCRIARQQALEPRWLTVFVLVLGDGQRRVAVWRDAVAAAEWRRLRALARWSTGRDAAGPGAA